MNEGLRREILALRQDDVRVRSELERAGRLFRGYDPDMEAVHRRNAARLREIVAAHGWPGRTLVGDDGAEAAWLVALHAVGEPDFQRESLRLLQGAAGRGDVPRWHAAYLDDRIRVAEGWPQLYGTQLASAADGSDTPHPIAHRAQVDERRRAVGLAPLPREHAVPPGAWTDATPAQRQAFEREMHAWARRVGWRPRILHLAAAADWRAAEAAGAYTADSLETEGFIHCSEPQQVIRVANARFRGRPDLTLLQIAVAKLAAPLRYENLEGGDELFPHIYGPLNLDAVIAATPFPPDANGGFDLDQLAAAY